MIFIFACMSDRAVQHCDTFFSPTIQYGFRKILKSIISVLMRPGSCGATAGLIYNVQGLQLEHVVLLMLHSFTVRDIDWYEVSGRVWHLDYHWMSKHVKKYWHLSNSDPKIMKTELNCEVVDHTQPPIFQYGGTNNCAYFFQSRL